MLYVKENTAYSKDFIWAIYGFIKFITYSYINIFKNMFKIHREIGPLVVERISLDMISLDSLELRA